jgi:NAD(P)-dependent dehydrogenase (short-subunit alcohol dehydrogenase family)
MMTPTSRRFEGKQALVTGAGSGIGRAIAVRLAAEGAHVTVLDLAMATAQETVAVILGAGGQATPVACDVADTTAMGRVIGGSGRIDVLVTSAGIAHVGSVETTTPADLDRLYAVNVKGVYHSLHFAVPKMLAAGGGVILNLASIAARVGLPDRFAYSMTKGAVLAMTLSVARDYVNRGIRCNCLCPARVHTPFVDGFLAKNYPDHREEMFRQLSAAQPIGRMGTPEEIAALAAFLCSSESAFITGSAYDIDGGVSQLR